MVINSACLGHLVYVYVWILNEFGTVVHLKHLFRYIEGQGQTIKWSFASLNIIN